MDKEKGEGWQKVKKGKAVLKPTEKKNIGPSENSQTIPEVTKMPKEATSTSTINEVTKVHEENPKKVEKEGKASDLVGTEETIKDK